MLGQHGQLHTCTLSARHAGAAPARPTSASVRGSSVPLSPWPLQLPPVQLVATRSPGPKAHRGRLAGVGVAPPPSCLSTQAPNSGHPPEAGVPLLPTPPCCHLPLLALLALSLAALPEGTRCQQQVPVAELEACHRRRLGVVLGQWRVREGARGPGGSALWGGNAGAGCHLPLGAALLRRSRCRICRLRRRGTTAGARGCTTCAPQLHRLVRAACGMARASMHGHALMHALHA